MTALPICEVSPAPVSTTAGWRQQHPSWLYSALLTGHLRNHGQVTQDWPLKVRGLGRLPLPSGRLVTGDPYVVDPDHSPVDQVLPRGEHEVLVARASVGEGRRNAAALLLTGSRPITSWTMVGDSQDAPDGTVTAFSGYDVEAGTGCFVDAGGLMALSRVMSPEGGKEDPISTALGADDADAAATCTPPAPGELPVAAFSSGWGNGTYPTWLGLGSDGSVSLVMTDFLLAQDPWARIGDDPTHARARLWHKLFRRKV